MTGMGRYLSNLLRYLPEVDPANEYILVSYRPLAVPIPGTKNVATSGAPRNRLLQKLFSPFWLNFILPRVLKREKIDVFFAPNNLLPVRNTCTKNIVTIADVFPLVDTRFHPWWHRAYVSFVMSHSLGSADLVLTISESSKRDIVRLLRVPEEKVCVTYLAAEECFMPREISSGEQQRLRQKYDLPEKFVLYIGVVEERKNIKGIIEIADFLAPKTDTAIVVVGRVGHGGEPYVEAIKKRKNMHYSGFVDERDMPYLYNLATAFLFPSFYEGFGLPPLEAMQSGTPVVASNRSSLPEVIGDAGITLDPENSSAFADALLRIITNDAERASWVAKGIVQAKKFSYRTTAELTARAIRLALEHHKNL